MIKPSHKTTSWQTNALGALLSLLLLGCEQQHQDLRNYVQTTLKRPPMEVEPLPEFSSYQAISYNGNLVRDPFAPTVKSDEREALTNAQKGPQPNMQREREHLETFPLDGIRMVGIMDFDNIRYALLRTNEPTLYRITVGNYLGQNHGKVVAVNDSGLTIRELTPTATGGWQERTQELTVEKHH